MVSESMLRTKVQEEEHEEGPPPLSNIGLFLYGRRRPPQLPAAIGLDTKLGACFFLASIFGIFTMFRKSLLIAFLTLCSLMHLNTSGHAAEFNVVKSFRYGAWSAILYRNLNGNRLFCAVETTVGGTDFRINRYKASGETFLEIYNAKWSTMTGNVRFILDFDLGKENFQAELQGQSWGDSYSHDFTDVKNYTGVMALLSQSKSFEVRNSNNAVIGRFSGAGAQDAIIAYQSCLDN